MLYLVKIDRRSGNTFPRHATRDVQTIRLQRYKLASLRTRDRTFSMVKASKNERSLPESVFGQNGLDQTRPATTGGVCESTPFYWHWDLGSHLDFALMG